jgi:predicted ATP-dependent protease
MSPKPTLTRAAFDQIVAEQQELVRLANELELQLYRLGEQVPPSAERIADCQQAAGNLVGLLRQALFRQDQQILPLLESWISSTGS